jgi:hemoglobin
MTRLNPGAGRLMTPAVLAVAISLLCGAAQAGETSAKQASLYSRLGGYDAIVAVSNDLLPRLMQDPQLKRFWSNRGSDGLAREKQLLIDYVVASAGGPLHYVGRDMKQTHVGMKISEEDWEVFLKHLKATLTKFKLPDREFKETVAFVESTKKDIVE